MFEDAGFRIEWVGPVTRFSPRTQAISRLTHGRFDHLFTEHLAYLPVMLVFGKPEHLPALTPSPLARSGHITYGSFNRMNKLGDAVIALWAEILRSTPGSRLVLGAVTNDAVAEALRARFAARGIAHGRITFLPRLDMADYLAAQMAARGTRCQEWKPSLRPSSRIRIAPRATSTCTAAAPRICCGWRRSSARSAPSRSSRMA